MDPIYLEARDIDEAHFKLVRKLFQCGRTYVIKHGSFSGHKRLEFDYVTFKIKYPGTRPLAPQFPSGVPPVTSEDDIVNYASHYLMSPAVAEEEIYTYGSYIMPQLQPIIDMYKKSGGDTNQATITIGGKESISQEHPPCLRLIDTRLRDGKLNFVVYFRSWDLWAGLPENLGGIQILKEYLCSEIGCDDGVIIASSKGLHLYDYQWPTAFARINSTMPEGSIITEKEALLGEGWMK